MTEMNDNGIDGIHSLNKELRNLIDDLRETEQPEFINTNVQQKGTAQQYEEYLSLRMNEHQVIIEVAGTISGTDQHFTFHLTHRADKVVTISLDYE